MDNETGAPMDRRQALKAIAAAAATATLADGIAPTAAGAQQPVAITPRAKPGAPAPVAGPRGTPTDPHLLTPKADWPRLLTASELATVAVLCDVIIPADERSPGAATVGAPAYINEYVSAPYDWAERALVRVRGGLAWLDVESERRYTRRFTALTMGERTSICDDICYLPDTRPALQVGARFFDLMRDLTASAFYTSAAGMKDLQYMGNVPLAKWDGPPAEVLRKLGLA